MPRYSDRGRPLTAEEVDREIRHHVEDAGDFAWYFCEEFPVDRVRTLDYLGTGPSDDSPKAWARWYERARDGDDNWGGWGPDFEMWWSTGGTRPEECPIVVRQQANGFGVADGNHRVGVAHFYGMRAVPAYVGYRR